MLREGTFRQEHPVELTEEEKLLRASTASRAWPRLAEQEAAILSRKEAQKLELKNLEAEKALTIVRARESSRAAHEGHEPRQVDCREELVGAMVLTIRCDTQETVSDRPATSDEMRGTDKPRSATVTKLHAVKEDGGATPAVPIEDIGPLMRNELLTVCTKPRASTLVLKALAIKAGELQPGSTKKARESDAEATVALALKQGAIVRNDVGKLCLPAAVEPARDEIPFGDDQDPPYGEDGEPDEYGTPTSAIG